VVRGHGQDNFSPKSCGLCMLEAEHLVRSVQSALDHEITDEMRVETKFRNKCASLGHRKGRRHFRVTSQFWPT